LQVINEPPQTDESALYPMVSRLLSWKGYQTFESFPHGRYSPFEIDILGFKKESSELFMVEVKLRHVNKAFRQGVARLPYADYVSLAFPQTYAEYVYGKFRHELQNKGFGLISINGSAEEMIPPRRSIHLKSLLKDCILKDLNRKLLLDGSLAGDPCGLQA
jgi:hypothetical protein